MREGQREELEWWERFLLNRVYEQHAGWEHILDEHWEFPEHWAFWMRCLTDRKDLRGLDVGCGPLLRIGDELPDGRRVHWQGVDPLALEYNELRARAGLPSRGLMLPIDGARLTDAWPSRMFDVVVASNSLDHSEEPLAVLQQMAEVTRADGLIVISGFVNEGTHAGGVGLHRWDMGIDERGCLYVQSIKNRSVRRVFDPFEPLEGFDTVFKKTDDKWFEIILQGKGEQ